MAAAEKIDSTKKTGKEAKKNVSYEYNMAGAAPQY